MGRRRALGILAELVLIAALAAGIVTLALADAGPGALPPATVASDAPPG